MMEIDDKVEIDPQIMEVFTEVNLTLSQLLREMQGYLETGQLAKVVVTGKEVHQRLLMFLEEVMMVCLRGGNLSVSDFAAMEREWAPVTMIAANDRIDAIAARHGLRI